MAKMFYTLEEAAKRLGKSEDDVREMASKGQLQEFRDRERLMFKVEQVDLLAGDDDTGGSDDFDSIPLQDDDTGGMDLADDSGGLGLDLEDSSSDLMSDLSSASGTGIPLDLDDDEPAPSKGENAKERTGVSVFDVDDLEEADPSAVTQVTGGGSDLLGDDALESVGSGSGLLDITQESDDTSLGVSLDEFYSEDDGSDETIASSGLFEATGAESDEPLGGVVGASAGGGVGGAVMVEEYDGAGSGLVLGLCLGCVLALGLAMMVSMMGVLGAGSSQIVSSISDGLMMYVGIVAGVTLVAALAGFFLGKRAG